MTARNSYQTRTRARNTTAMVLTPSTWQKVYKCKLRSYDLLELQGYTLVDELFVDSSGFGADNEPALTQSQFEKEITALLKEHGRLHAFITGAGQFQVYVGLFKKERLSKVKKIANNTYKIDTPDGYIIRLHNTDIVTVHGNSITLNSGGWKTKTTKERINDHIAPRYISQKNYEWTVIDPINDTTTPFIDHMSINR